MGLRRRSCAPVRIRLRSSFWTSIGIGSLTLLAATVVVLVPVAPNGDAAHQQEGPQALGDSGTAPRKTLFSGFGLYTNRNRRLQDDDEEAVDMYPDDLILTRPYQDDPNRWLIILHCIGIAYMFLGLNTVCDTYFTGAIEMGVSTWKVQEDVAGATFMAAGGSAPELFTSLIGATVANNDVGFGTIVGSAVFNVLFVIGICGYLAQKDIDLTWWPLFRDCTYYIFGLGLLAYCASNERINIAEAIILFCAYIVYCIFMSQNHRIEPQVQKLINARKARKQVAPEVYKVGQTSGNSLAINGQSVGYAQFEDDPEPNKPAPISNESNMPVPEATPEPMGDVPLPPTLPDDPTPEGEDAEADLKEVQVVSESKEDGGEIEEDGDLMEWPEETKDRIIWILSLPVYIPIYYGIPKPDTEKKFYFTFIISLLFIAGFSFLLVWWVEILGEILHIPTIVMGFTLLAAGTSIPDAVSSVAVARAGHGDMAVSSSIGSNIFDILVGLPIPWMIKIAIVEHNTPGYQVTILSPYLTFYVLLLLFMVMCTVGSIHLLGWKLNKPLGLCMAILYLIFLVVAVSVEATEPEWLKM